jgi:hypothetical protein
MGNQVREECKAAKKEEAAMNFDRHEAGNNVADVRQSLQRKCPASLTLFA